MNAKQKRRERRKEKRMQAIQGGRGGESAADKFMREQVAEAAKNPVAFAQLMAKMQRGPTQEQLQEMQRAQQEAQQDLQRKQQETGVWMNVYLEKVRKIVASDVTLDEAALDAEVKYATLVADKAVAGAKDAARIG